MTTVISSSRKRRGANSGSPKESRVLSCDKVESSGGAQRHGGCGPRPRAGLRAAGIDLLRSPVTRLDADRPRGGTRGVSRGPRRAGWKRMTPPKCIPSTTALTGQESTPRERSPMAWSTMGGRVATDAETAHVQLSWRAFDLVQAPPACRHHRGKSAVLAQLGFQLADGAFTLLADTSVLSGAGLPFRSSRPGREPPGLLSERGGTESGTACVRETRSLQGVPTSRRHASRVRCRSSCHGGSPLRLLSSSVSQPTPWDARETRGALVDPDRASILVAGPTRSIRGAVGLQSQDAPPKFSAQGIGERREDLGLLEVR